MHSSNPRPLLSLAREARVALATVICATLAACASVGGGGPATTTPTTQQPGATAQVWPVRTHEHVDLWLHGYALLTRDTARVPYFRRGYRDRIATLKQQRNTYTQLDANREQLSQRLAANPALVNGQFVPLYFNSWDELRSTVQLFVQAQGNPNATNDQTVRLFFAVLASSFPTGADRDWLRLFTNALDDERNRFYHDWWTNDQRERAATLTAVDSLWQRVYRPKLQGYLDHTQQNTGELLLSIPLDGEGRTVTQGRDRNAVTVGFPDSPSAAVEAVYAFVHETVGSITTTAINDNTTPAQQRSGETAGYAATAPVRGGALLLQRTAPQLVQGYMRYYLRSAGVPAPSGDPTTAFNAAFPLPANILDAITHQLETVLGGI